VHSFKAGGRDWILANNVAIYRRVRALGVDLVGLAKATPEHDPLGELLGDMPRLVAVVYEFVRGQAEKPPGVSLEQFEEIIDGDTYQAMRDAFVQEWIDFFPPEARPVLRQMIDRGKEITSLTMARAMSELEQASTLMRTELTSSSTTAPESSASTPSP
jgi:hypothetical protein